jgi:thiamine-phosphate pyrophosphorylase
MSSDRNAPKLARLARALNAPRGLPPLILMTDEARVQDPIAAARNLPRGCAIIVRHRDSASRALLAMRLHEISDSRGLLLLISQDAELTIKIGADGLHLPEARAREAAHFKALRPHWLVTVAAHSAAAVAIAARAGADAALLAPVFPTRSHPERATLGVMRARLIARSAALPVYALGGVNAVTALRLSDSRFAGFAAIEALSQRM